MLLRFLEDKAFSRDGVTVVRVQAGDVAEVPSRLAARYLEQGVCVDPGVKAAGPAPENKAAETPAPAPAPAGAPRRGGRRRAG